MSSKEPSGGIPTDASLCSFTLNNKMFHVREMFTHFTFSKICGDFRDICQMGDIR